MTISFSCIMMPMSLLFNSEIMLLFKWARIDSSFSLVKFPSKSTYELTNASFWEGESFFCTSNETKRVRFFTEIPLIVKLPSADLGLSKIA